jgi:hypothetical protein
MRGDGRGGEAGGGGHRRGKTLGSDAPQLATFRAAISSAIHASANASPLILSASGASTAAAAAGYGGAGYGGGGYGGGTYGGGGGGGGGANPHADTSVLPGAAGHGAPRRRPAPVVTQSADGVALNRGGLSVGLGLGLGLLDLGFGSGVGLRLVEAAEARALQDVAGCYAVHAAATGWPLLMRLRLLVDAKLRGEVGRAPIATLLTALLERGRGGGGAGTRLGDA